MIVLYIISNDEREESGSSRKRGRNADIILNILFLKNPIGRCDLGAFYFVAVTRIGLS